MKVTPADLPSVDETEPREGLRRDLTQFEDAMLRIVFSPFYGPTKQWPTWTYVSRKMYRETGQDAWSVWQGLPKVTVSNAYGEVIQYGLLWRTNRSTGEVWPDERIGLTIAGLLAISHDTTAAREFADWAVGVGGSCAQYEIDSPPDPGQSDTIQIETGPWHESLKYFTGLTPGMPPQFAWAMFRNEPILPAVMDGISTPEEGVTDWKLRVLPRDRQLINVESPEQYLDLVEAESHRWDPGPTPVSPTDLVRALDFFAMAVALAPTLGWQNAIAPRRLLPVARLTKQVFTSEEFSDRISALSNIFGDINLPRIPPEDWSGSQPPGSLNRLEYWLVTKRGLAVQDDIKILRAINKVRAHFQHPQADGDAHRHYRVLGLEMPVTKWSASWDAVMAHATHAFQSIADAVLDAASDGDDATSA
jgi:hypothetical protein